MPLVQVDMPRPLYEKFAKAMSVEIHQASIEALGVNPLDKFQIFRPREEGEIIFEPTYNGVDRQNLVLIQLLMVHRYPVDQKRRFYRELVTRLEAIGLRRQDIHIAITENGFEDWYAGKLYGE